MKVRTDFITNSSSSSFIISLKNDKTYYDFKKAIIDMLNAHNDLTNDDLNYYYIFEDHTSEDQREFTLWSCDDNCIPYWLMDYLENVLDAKKIYQG